MCQEKIPEKVRIVYMDQHGDEKHPFVDGVSGTIRSGGILILDFYYDTFMPRTSETFKVNPDRSFGDKISSQYEYDAVDDFPVIVRTSIGGIAVSIKEAESIANFILKKVREYHKMSESEEKKDG